MSDSLLDADLSDLLRKGYAELEDLLKQEDEAEQRLWVIQSKVARLSQKIIQLAIASDDKTLVDAVRETGLTEAIRTVLQGAEKPLSAVEIRTRLEEIGFDVSAYQNFLATLYLTLQRLDKQNEVSQMPLHGKKTYMWQFAKPTNTFREALKRRMLPNEGVTVVEPLLPPTSVKPIQMIDETGKPKKVIK